MAGILRGEIRWALLDPVRGHEQAGTRPVLVLSHEAFNRNTRTAIAVALTSREPRMGFPVTLRSEAEGLPKTSWILIHQIRVLSVDRLGAVLGWASEEEMEQVVEGLLEIIG